MKWGVRILWVCLAMANLGCDSALAAKAAPSEYEVKAAFLFNFIKFIEWPANLFPEKGTPIVIGVLGSDPFFDSVASMNYLDQAVEGKTINDRKIVIKRFERGADLKNCHLLFISKSERSRIKDVLAKLKGSSVLTVSEVEGFCQQGGMINFVMQSGKVRFEINNNVAEKSGLKISSKLLNVATVVLK